MKDVNSKVEAIRESMIAKGLDAYIIPSSDPHLSEYVAPHWEGRKWTSGFTGSAGTLVITGAKAGLWTDGRYHIQAEKELEGPNIELFRAGQDGVPSYIEWLGETLCKGNVVALYGQLFSVSVVKNIEKKLESKGICINTEYDLVDEIWEDRPAVPDAPAMLHTTIYAGKTVQEKIHMIRGEMQKKRATYHLVSSLDDIAWLFNIRGGDVLYNPVVLSYALISSKQAWLFIDERKLDDNLRCVLQEQGVEIQEYEEISQQLQALGQGETILYNPQSTNYWLYGSLGKDCQKIEGDSIPNRLKAIKNETEIQGLGQSHIRDGAAMVRFLYWLKENLGKIDITEIMVGEKLEDFRRQQQNFQGPSFTTIAAYKDHAAMMHYQATPAIQYSLQEEGMLLIDSGGQYLDGTTDITRTVILGDISSQQRRDFTLTLKGHINLAKAKFLNQATGSNLDILARQALWAEGIDYKCGTGHGVGYFLSVHEGPQRISQVPTNIKLEPGMVVTNEPGVYRAGQHGIRIENQMLVVEDQKTEFGQFLKFEILTLCPIDIEGIEIGLLTKEEKQWLNEYHERVYKTLSPLLSDGERQWLKKVTRAL